MNTPTKAALWFASSLAVGYGAMHLQLWSWQQQAARLVVARLSEQQAEQHRQVTAVSCGTCAYSLAILDTETGEGSMQCRWGPPHATVNAETVEVWVAFPAVDSSDSCSQWTPTLDPERQDLGGFDE